jgi:hypothetical protein
MRARVIAEINAAVMVPRRDANGYRNIRHDFVVYASDGQMRIFSTAVPPGLAAGDKVRITGNTLTSRD